MKDVFIGKEKVDDIDIKLAANRGLDKWMREPSSFKQAIDSTVCLLNILLFQ
jgi:hypothetical protein